MKKGRHRRFEEARAFKLRATELAPEPCAECGADPEDDHASWCLATEELATDDPEHDAAVMVTDVQETGEAGHGHAADGT